jgi:phage FluMu protein Com
MMMKVQQKATRRSMFSKIGGSTYPCAVCGRLTRHTGAQSLGSKTCPQCYELAGIENEISDRYRTQAEAQPQIDALIAEIVAKGGDVAEWARLQAPKGGAQ